MGLTTNMITQHVTSLELSKQLYEAGINIKDSQFIWLGRECEVRASYPKNHWAKRYPAPLSSELGELLPRQVQKDGHFYSLAMSKTAIDFWIDYRYYASTKSLKIVHLTDDVIENTEANARAKMLLYLKEKGLL